ncbi:Spy/CpxP family protein refolding chaperone [Devosia sp. 2618]|uniref:Spy/CpxP family protein refolding chaperone n=1 Tax=Devosia sp. 2618 TaxID=3156454 RepID=UPI0033995F58
MKTITSTAIVALMTATIGLSAVAPGFAQTPTAPVQAEQQKSFRPDNQGPRHGGPRGGGDFLNFDRGSEAVEIALVRLSHRIELTATQQPLFDAFKTAALTAATDFTKVTDALRPAAPVEGQTPTPPAFSERLDNSIKLQAARLDALEAIQPSAKAFFDSLTAEQQMALAPQRPDRNGGPGLNRGPGNMGQPGGHGHGPQGGPGAPPAPPAPATNG